MFTQRTKMLKKVKKGQDAKKNPNKQKIDPTAKVNRKEPNSEIEISDEDQTFDLVNIDYTSKQGTKVKPAPKKKNKSNLHEAEIIIEKKFLENKIEEPVRTTWVANSIEEAFGKKFDIKDQSANFQSLTDQGLNQRIRKQLQEPETKIASSQLCLTPLQKSIDQMAMQKVKDTEVLSSNKKQFYSSKLPLPHLITKPRNFLNSNGGSAINSVPIQKTPQQLRMEEAERKQDELTLKKNSDIWLGTKRNTNYQQEMRPKITTWAMRSMKTSKAQLCEGQDNQDNSNTGIQFIPLHQSSQQAKLARQIKQQELIFVFKKEKKGKRQEKQGQLTIQLQKL